MNRNEYKSASSAARASRNAVKIYNGTQCYALGRAGVDPIAENWNYARPWQSHHAVALLLSGYVRRALGRADRGLVDMARQYRLTQSPEA